MAQTEPTSLRIHSPIGPLRLKGAANSLVAIYFGDASPNAKEISKKPPLLQEVQVQLKQYFSGERKTFDLPLAPAGTAFEKEVWQALRDIPFGQTITYLELAKKLGDPNKVRAVGRANGQNPLPVIIPCHRVIGSNNKLTGYSGGIERKRWLLQHEGALLL